MTRPFARRTRRPSRAYMLRSALVLVLFGLLSTVTISAPPAVRAATTCAAADAATQPVAATLKSQFPTLANQLNGQSQFRESSQNVGGQAQKGFDARPTTQSTPAGWQSSAALKTFYPATYCAPFVAESGALRVEVQADGARAATARIESGTLTYANAYAHTDSVHVMQAGESKEFLLLRDAAAPTRFGYSLSLSKGANVALKNGAVVFAQTGNGKTVDSLRIAAPYVVDASGKRHAEKSVIRWELDGTRLSLELNPAGLSYPLAVDPSWQGGGALPSSINEPVAVTLTDGTVLFIGGTDSGLDPTTLVSSYDYRTNTWSSAPQLTSFRSRHTATLMKDGRILVAGGYTGTATESVEVYQVGSGSTATMELNIRRFYHTATLLNDGRVLVTGGQTYDNGNNAITTRSAEVYSPTTETWATVGNMADARQQHTATLLPNGKVLIAGGYNAPDANPLSSAEIFDPATNTFSPAAASNNVHAAHNAVLLNDGTVLVAAGILSGAATNAAELYNPNTNSWSATAGQPTVPARTFATLSKLSDGRVILVGGKLVGTGVFDSTEIYDPTAKTFSTSPAMPFGRAGHAAAALPNNTVLIGGGANYDGTNVYNSSLIFHPDSAWTRTTTGLSSAYDRPTVINLHDGRALIYNSRANNAAEIYNPSDGSFTPIAAAASGHYDVPTATLLKDGRVLVAGGNSASGSACTTSAADIYDPTTNSWTAAAPMLSPRTHHSATLLSDGRVLVAGGYNYCGSVSNWDTAEIYNPQTNGWTSLGSVLGATRYDHTATRLNDGRVLIAGGYGTSSAPLASAVVYNPGTNSFTPVSNMTSARANHTATLATNGKVILMGGWPGVESSPSVAVDIFDPATNSFSAGSPMPNARAGHSAALLPSGNIVVACGQSTGAGVLVAVDSYNPDTNSWTSLPTLNDSRETGTLTLLANDLLFVVGGDNQLQPLSVVRGNGQSSQHSAELYDPALPTWQAVAPMAHGRISPAAILLPNGKVLVAGGEDSAGNALNTAELYDPATNSWSPAANLPAGRAAPQAILLPNGTVLVAGGSSVGVNVQSRGRNPRAILLPNAVVYDSKTNSWKNTGNLQNPRFTPAAILLPNGTGMLLGGTSDGTNNGALKSTEVYDPNTNTWSSKADMSAPRNNPSAILLPNGAVFVDNGTNAILLPNRPGIAPQDVGIPANAETYDYTANNFSVEPNPSAPRNNPAAILLPNGTVLEAGGTDAAGTVLASAEEDNPQTDSEAGSTMNVPRNNPAAILLPNGKALVAGGTSTTTDSGTQTSAETYDPSTDAWTLTTNLHTPRNNPAAILLPNGKVLVLGGEDTGGNALASAEVYDSGLGIAASRRPVIQNIAISNDHTELSDGDFLTIKVGNATSKGSPIVKIRSAANNETFDAQLLTWDTSTIVTDAITYDNGTQAYHLPPGLAYVSVYVNGVASDEYPITVAVSPDGVLAARLTYAKVSALTGHDVTVEWAAARESRALGYDIYAAGGTTRLNAHIIPAHSLTSTPDGIYQATVTLPDGVNVVNIVDVEPGGKSRTHGPFSLNSTFGRIPTYAPPVPTQDPNPVPTKPIRLATTDVALSIAKDGIYHLTYEQLLAQKVNLSGARPAKIALSAGGKDVPLYVKTARADRFAAGDWIEFAATALDTDYSGVNVYVLTARSKGKVTHLAEPPSVTLAPKPGASAAITTSLELPGRSFYWGDAPADSRAWEWALLENDIPQYADQIVSFDLPRLYNADSFGSQQVTVTLKMRGWGGYAQVNPDHHAIADLAGAHAEVSFDNNDTAFFRLTLPASALKQTGNSLRLRAPGVAGAQFDTMFLESISVSYPQATALPALETQVAGVRTYTRSATLSRTLSRRVDYVIISPAALAADTLPLARQHRREKLRVATVDVNAIYDSYSGGVTDPAAIQKFIADAKAKRGLKYVLLVGADSIDPRGYVTKNAPSLIPAYHAPDSQGTRAPSDSPYADVDGDGLPDMALGRLPVRNSAELQALVAKTLTFTRDNSATLTATFVTDPKSNVFETMAHMDGAKLPKSATATYISWKVGAPDTALAALVAAWKGGSRFISYTGHSNSDQWADDNVLDSAALPQLKPSTPALLTIWGCWTANYDRPNRTSLGQALLALEAGGAAAVVASTTEVDAQQYAPTSSAFVAALYANGKSQRIGDALVQAKRTVLAAHPTWQDIRAGITLLGDPAARL